MNTQMNAIDGARFREVLGHYPTGVSVVTATTPAGMPVGMVVGTFTSVSLEPPLVAFLPDKSSTSWPLIHESGSFCANVLSADQEVLCRKFAKSGGNKFEDVEWTPSASGSPILNNVVAWVDCDIEQVVESGDHYIVIGRVRDLDVMQLASPLAFFRGQFGQISPQPATSSMEVTDNSRSVAEQVAALFAERGPRRTMAREIANLAGESADRFDELFPSRDQIVDHLLTDYLQTLLDRYKEAVNIPGGSAQTLSALIGAMLASVDDHRAATVLFQNERANISTDASSTVPALEHEMRELWTAVISEGMKTGAFRSDVDASMVYYFIRDAAFMAARWHRPEGRYTTTELAGQYTRLILDGVATNRPSR
ncbi:flavin reductase [Specibacter sp. RAF43]|uniref:flavin reductase n=1 Tax=Specibacter sp. RAF43 TaxID=3233057 RepID=UPI003F98CCC7